MAPGVSTCHYGEAPLSISFSGCGFLATYQLGVAQCFLNYAPWILSTAPSVIGASAGSLVAGTVVCRMNPVTIRDEMLNFAKHMKAFTLGPFNPSVNLYHWLEYVLRKNLPSDAHKLANGRLAVAMTRLTDGKHTVISEFQSKEDVVQALLCSCFVPGYCGILPPSFKGVHYVDGGFTSMQPVLPETSNQTLTVSPFSGDTDICPADEDSRWEIVVSGTTLKGNSANTIRIFNALYPMALETLEQAYHSGYKDAIQFLLHNDLAPYIMVHKLTNSQLKCNQSKTWIHVNAALEEDEEMKGKEQKSALTSFTENTHMQKMMMSNLTRNQTNQEPPLHFDMIKNVLLHSSLVAYLSMFGLPARILSYLLFPVMLWFYVILQSRQRMEVLFRQAPEFLFWTWCSLRCFIFFLSNIFVYTFKKSMMDRVMPIILFLQWLKIQPQFDVLQEKGHTTAWNNFSFSAHSENIKHRSPH